MDINDLNFDLDPEELEDDTPVEKQWLTSEDALRNPEPPVDPINPNQPEPPQPVDDNTKEVWAAFLEKGGISDPEHIKFEQPDGIITERSWNELTGEEQLNILQSLSQDPDTDLDENEIALINQIRNSGMTPSEFIQSIRPQTSYEPANSYDFTNLSDDELYMLDLMSRSDMTEEEAKIVLEAAKQQPEIFEKQIKGIRQNVMDRQAEAIQQQQLEQQEAAQALANSILTEIENFTSVGNVDVQLQDEDMNQLAEFILPRDGISAFGQALNDPKNIVKAAYFLQFGDQIMQDLSTYVAEQVKAARQAGYSQGLREGQEKAPKSRVVVQPQQQSTENNKPKNFLELNYE